MDHPRRAGVGGIPAAKPGNPTPTAAPPPVGIEMSPNARPRTPLLGVSQNAGSRAPDVPIGRGRRGSSGDVRCARSVRGGRARIGSSGASVPPVRPYRCDRFSLVRLDPSTQQSPQMNESTTIHAVSSPDDRMDFFHATGQICCPRRSSYRPGGRYVAVFLVAASRSAAVRSTTVRAVAPPPPLTVSAAEAAETSSGMSTMT